MTRTWRQEVAREQWTQGDRGPILFWSPDEASFDDPVPEAGYRVPDGFVPRVAWSRGYVYVTVFIEGELYIYAAPRFPKYPYTMIEL